MTVRLQIDTKRTT